MMDHYLITETGNEKQYRDVDNNNNFWKGRFSYFDDFKESGEKSHVSWLHQNWVVGSSHPAILSSCQLVKLLACRLVAYKL